VSGSLTEAQRRALSALQDAGPRGLTAAEFGRLMWESPAWTQRSSQGYARAGGGFLGKLRRAGLASQMDAPGSGGKYQLHYLTEKGRRALAPLETGV
jgi:hypothetical protein